MLILPYEPRDLEGFLKLFTFDNRRALERYARSLVIHSADFVAFIETCKRGVLPLRHRAHYSERLPEHLALTQDDHQALRRNGVGPLKPRAAKTVRKVFQTFKERQTLAGHMFFTPGLHEWHFFALDQNDLLDDRKNHWAHGAHFHFVNWLWPQLDPREVWSRLVIQREKPGSSLHVRHDSGVCGPGT